MTKGNISKKANKRKFGSDGKGGGSPYAQLPRRGPPAIFVTCESGREKKCQRESLELMHHYYYLSREDDENHSTSDVDGESNNLKKNLQQHQKQQQKEPLSLEEELSLLRKGAMAEEVLTYERSPKRHKSEDNNIIKVLSMKSPFSIYDSGVRGVICIICNLSGSEVIPYDDIVSKVKAAKKVEGKDKTSFSTNDSLEGKFEDTENRNGEDKKSDEKHSSMPSTRWDPVDTVKRIMEGMTEESNTSTDSKVLSSPPSSRFISRMIPMQATCYASIDEIKLVTKSLLRTYLSSILRKSDASACTTITFKIDIKRRLCSHITRDQVIEAITPMVLGNDKGSEKKHGCRLFSVNLSDPDFAIRIEIVKTLCGVSILPREQWYKNFNLSIAKDDDKKD